MPDLFGKSWDRKSLMRRIGSVREIDVRIGSGFAFTGVPDRTHPR